MKDDILCRECSDHYATLLRIARLKISELNLPSRSEEKIAPAPATRNVHRTLDPLYRDNFSAINRTIGLKAGQENLTQGLTQPQKGENEQLELDGAKPREMLRDFERLEAEIKLREIIRELEGENESLRRQLCRNSRLPSAVMCYLMILVGAFSLVFSIVLSSTVLVFIGLGLAFWGALLRFIRPQKLVRPDLMDSTALSSLEAVDYFIGRLGYAEKGIYLPRNGNPANAVVFLPSEPLEEIPSHEEMEKRILAKKGLVLIPPGLALADLIQHELGEKFNQSSLEKLRERLRKVLIEDLEIVDDFDMQIDGSTISMKLVGSIHTDFCKKLKNKRICSMLGCPLCSAMACLLAQTTGKPVLFKGDERTAGARILESKYDILDDLSLWSQTEGASTTCSKEPFTQVLKQT
jgi:hypothetical protein